MLIFFAKLPELIDINKTNNDYFYLCYNIKLN